MLNLESLLTPDRRELEASYFHVTNGIKKSLKCKIVELSMFIGEGRA